MEQDRIEPAVQRIEAALARIAAAADAVPASAPVQTGPAPADEALRETVVATLAELDQLIERLEG